jgi:hypothetical protein
LRWFGRPEKYRYGYNTLWIHVERDGTWYLLKITVFLDDMYRVVGALKAFAPHLLTPYRRMRPYIHVDPTPARFAEQDIHGVWTLLDRVSLYLMPLYLVLFDGEKVSQQIALDRITQVSGIKRLDDEGGVVRFRKRSSEGEKEYAFALDNYVEFAEALSEAAKRSLEMPTEIISRKKKKSDEDTGDE